MADVEAEPPISTRHSRAGRHTSTRPLPLPECCALVLQGGGALGSYQAGVYETLDDWQVPINWVAGISIGAINAALIAGNPPERRVERLRTFWDMATSVLPDFPIWPGAQLRELVNETSAAIIAMTGVPGFFAPRWLPPLLAKPGTPAALSLYDTEPLRETLLKLVDFDLLNDGPVRYSAGAVNVRTGNFVYFDNRDRRIGPEHVMASGALPPGLPPVEIDGELYWDGGIVSNTPLQHILDHQYAPTLIFQVDLFPAEGEVPDTLFQAAEREKDIRFSSRTRLSTDMLLHQRKLKKALQTLLDRLPPELRNGEDVELLCKAAKDLPVSIVHLIHRSRRTESQSKDYEFSRRSMLEHWSAGGADVRDTMHKSGVIARNFVDGGTAAFDLTRE